MTPPHWGMREVDALHWQGYAGGSCVDPWLSAASITPWRYIRLNIVHTQAILKRFIELQLFIRLHTELNSVVNSVC